MAFYELTATQLQTAPTVFSEYWDSCVVFWNNNLPSGVYYKYCVVVESTIDSGVYEDFITYGYEFDPKLLVKFQQANELDFQKYLNDYKKKVNKSAQKNSSTKLSVFSNRGGFFTTNKSEYKNVDKTLKSREEKSSSDGLLSKIFKQQGFQNRIRKFEGLKFKEKERYRQNDSNKDHNISKLILKDMEINNITDEINEKDKENENNLLDTGIILPKDNIFNKNKELEKEK